MSYHELRMVSSVRLKLRTPPCVVVDQAASHVCNEDAQPTWTWRNVRLLTKTASALKYVISRKAHRCAILCSSLASGVRLQPAQRNAVAKRRAEDDTQLPARNGHDRAVDVSYSTSGAARRHPTPVQPQHLRGGATVAKPHAPPTLPLHPCLVHTRIS